MTLLTTYNLPLTTHHSPLSTYNYPLSKPTQHILFANLTAFSATGGLEKFNRTLLHGLQLCANEGLITVAGISLYDTAPNTAYFTAPYWGMSGRRIAFIRKFIQLSYKADTIIIGHVNLAVPVLLKRLIMRRKKIIVVAHGIDITRFLKKSGKVLLQKCHQIWAVSEYTKQQILLRCLVSPNKIVVYHNALDPFFERPKAFQKPSFLQTRYGIAANQPIILTLARLRTTEKDKGYDLVIQAMPKVLQHFPNAYYVIAGKADAAEKQRLETLIAEYKLQQHVQLIGYVEEAEMVAHYQLGDVFIMPSRKEGFGIVFIEAMSCGVPAIAGNMDGSVDALLGGKVGYLVNPTDVEAIANTLVQALEQAPAAQPQQLQQQIEAHFGFLSYQQRLQNLLTTN